MSKEDLFDECYDRQVSPEDFKQVFCNRCRNPRCTHAGWARDLFGERVHTQVDRLFNTDQAEPDDPRFSHLQEIEFPSLLRQAVRLNLADQRGDWSIPEENVHLAPIAGKPASEESSALVEEAVKNLKPESDVEPENPPAESAPPPAESAPPEPALPKPPVPVHFRSGSMNTEVPAEGVMLDGDEVPISTDTESDPWAPKKKEDILKPGATVTMNRRKPK